MALYGVAGGLKHPNLYLLDIFDTNYGWRPFCAITVAYG